MDIGSKKAVIVSALFDIGRDKWNRYNCSYGGYLDWMERLLAIDNDMVIFTDRFGDEIQRRREKYGHSSKLVIIEQPIEETYSYKNFHDKLNRLMSSGEFKRKIQFDVPEMVQPLYNIVMFNKVYFMREVFDENYLDNDILLWVDAGCFREGINSSKWPDINKLNFEKPLFFSHVNDIRINDWEFHAMSQIRNIQGGCFVCPSNQVGALAECFETIVETCIHDGFIGSDEKILDFVYLMNHENYDLYKCGWREYYNILK